MADNEPTISMAGINAPPLYRLVEDGDKTVIVTADTNTPMWVINGKIGGDTVETMTTAERTAITPEAGQLIYDTTLELLFVGDGSTQGGTAVGGGGGGGVVPGYRLSDDGTALNFNPVQPIVNVTGSSVTLQPDTAYKMYATTGALNVTANPPAANYWGLEGHAEIFVGSVGYVVFDTSKIVLANQLEPDSVNNCTLRFHDGICYVSVEDHIAGYIVVNGATSGDGSLYYGISTSTNDYVAFDASLNGTIIPLAGAVAEGEKHVVGNGYSETTLTGSVDCGTSKFTVANLSLQDVVVGGGTMTLGDAYVPSGSTVAVSGGGLAVEKVTGAGETSVIDLGGTNVYVHFGATASAAGCVFTNGGGDTDGYGGAIRVRSGRKLSIDNCIISGNTASLVGVSTRGGAIYNAGNLDVSNSVIIGNRASLGPALDLSTNNSATHISGSTIADNYNLADPPLKKDILLYGGHIMYIDGECTMGVIDMGTSATLNISGSNTFVDYVSGTSPNAVINISSGAILDLTGNTNATPINPGGGIIVSGGCTVINSAGASVSIAGGTYTKINNDGTTE